MSEKGEEMRMLGLVDPEQPAAAARPAARPAAEDNELDPALQAQILAFIAKANAEKKKKEDDDSSPA